MAEQIKRLSDETKNLRSELKMAQDRLTLKELDISKEKLKSADVELQLKREIQKVTLKLQESESKNRALERQLTGTEDIRVTLAMSLEKIQALEDQLKMSTKENAPAPARAPVGKDKVPSPEPVKAKAPAPATPKEKTPVPAPVPVEVETPVVEQVPAAKKAPVPEPVPAKGKIPPAEPLTVDPPKPTPKAVPAKKASSRKKSAGLKGSTAKAEAPKSQDELKLSVEAPKTKKAPTPVADAPKPKKATTAVAKNPKTKEKKTVPETTSDGDDWSILSESTLSRKTVKELMDYLSDKVC